MPEISIVVPVYNVEKYIHRCVDSILAQTFTDFEVILVEDGSPDNCPAICDEYAAKDHRVHVIHQRNSGVSIARNMGIEMAQSQYIGFVDADDWIASEMYEKMLSKAAEEQADIVMCDAQTVHESGKTCPDTINLLPESTVLKCDQLTPELMLEFAGSACRCIYSSSMLQERDVRFLADQKLSEDRVFNIYAMGYANRICYLKEPYYFRFVNWDSAVHRYHPDYFEIAKKAAQNTKRALAIAWGDSHEYQVAYLRQFVWASLAAIDNLNHKDSNLSWIKRLYKTYKICIDHELRDAISCYGYGGKKGKWVLDKRIIKLCIYQSSFYNYYEMVKNVYLQEGLIGVVKRCLHKVRW